MMYARLAALAAAPLALVATPALATATGPDFSTLTDAITFESAQTAVLSVGALAIGLVLVILGIKLIMAMIRRAS